MSLHLGNVPASSTLYIPFATYGKTNGESITLTGLATSDIEIYKNGSTTQRSSDNGYALLDTDGIDFDGITGIHGFSVDLSDNTDAGFYAVGSFYWVVVSSVTVDGSTVNFIAATFRIVVAEGVTGAPKVDVHAVSADTTAADNLETAFDDTAGAVPWAGIIDQGTAQAAASGSLQLRSAATFANDEPLGASIQITGGSTGVGQSRTITDYDSATDTATVDPWTVTPTGTIIYKIWAVPPGPVTPISVNVTQISGDSAAADNLESVLDGTGANLTGNLVGGVTGSVGSVTGNVGGSVASLTVNNDKTGYRLSATGVDDVLDEVVEGSTTLRESVRLANSANGAKVDGAGTTTVHLRDLADSKNRVTATVDTDGNRTAVTRDLT